MWAMDMEQESPTLEKRPNNLQYISGWLTTDSTEAFCIKPQTREVHWAWVNSGWWKMGTVSLLFDAASHAPWRSLAQQGIDSWNIMIIGKSMKSWGICAHMRDPPPDPYLYPLPPLLNGERRERIKTLSNVFSLGFVVNYSIVRIKRFTVRQYNMPNVWQVKTFALYIYVYTSSSNCLDISGSLIY